MCATALNGRPAQPTETTETEEVCRILIKTLCLAKHLNTRGHQRNEIQNQIHQHATKINKRRKTSSVYSRHLCKQY